MALVLKLAVNCLLVASQPVVDLGDEAVSLLQKKASKHAAEGAPEAAVMKSLFPMEPPFRVGDDFDTAAFRATKEEGKAILENDKDAFSKMQKEGEAMLGETMADLQLKEAPTGEVASGMRFPNVGTVENFTVDVIVSVPEDYHPGRLNKRKTNGLWKGFARVWFQANTTQLMKVQVVKNGTNEPVQVPLLGLNMFSIGMKRKERFALSVSQCVTDKMSDTWFGPGLNETDGGCGGKTYKATSFLRRRDQPKNVEDITDKFCPSAVAFKWWKVSEVTLELSVGEPKKKKAMPFIFKLGLSKCSFLWAPEPEVKTVSKAELKANKRAERIRKRKEKQAAKKLAKENAKRERKSR